MKCWRHLVITLAVIISLFLIFSQTAYAYIDPGTGSIMIQVLIGAIVGGLATIGIFWRKVKTFLGNVFDRQRRDENIR